MKMKQNYLTFDIEEWYLDYSSRQIPREKWGALPSRVEPSTMDILNLLDELGQKATFFVMGYVAERYPDLVREIVHRGHALGYHSYYHDPPFRQSPEEFESELAAGLELLEKISAQKVVMFRAPEFSLNYSTEKAIGLLLQYGIKISSSFRANSGFLGKRVPDRPFIIRQHQGDLYEFPLSTGRFLNYNFVYSGSGYFRILPSFLITKLIRRQAYNMSYFHPRDFDRGVPFSRELPFYRNIMNRVGKDKMKQKLSKIISDFNFKPLSRADVENNDEFAIMQL